MTSEISLLWCLSHRYVASDRLSQHKHAPSDDCKILKVTPCLSQLPGFLIETEIADTDTSASCAPHPSP